MHPNLQPVRNRIRPVTQLLRVQFGVEQQTGHANHAIHRRSDFVAHVGHELRLVFCCRQRSVPRRCQLGITLSEFGKRVLQLARARTHLFLEHCVLFTNF